MRLFCRVFLALILFSSSAWADVSTTTRPFPGIAMQSIVRADPPLHFYVVTVDLGDPHLHLRVSRGAGDDRVAPPWETQLTPVSQMADRDGLVVAVNGNLFEPRSAKHILGRTLSYFPGNWARACGWAMSDGVLFSPSPADPTWPSLVVDDRGRVTIGRLERIPAGARQIVSGLWQIVTDGRDTSGYRGPDDTDRAPRTATGISRDGKTLLLLVADGRRPSYSVGMSWKQTAHELLSRGAWNALLLDGGGSSTLVMRNGRGKADVVNLPSDGHDLPVALSIPRSVANAFGVVIDGAATRP